MTAKTNKMVLFTAVALMAGWHIAESAPIVIAEYTFDDNLEGWTADSGLAEHHGDGYLELDFNTGGIEDWVRSPALPDGDVGMPADWRTMDSGYTSDDIMGATIRFDFYADTETGYPATLMPYFKTDVGAAEHTWYLDLTDEAEDRMAGAPDWHTFTADAYFASMGGWFSSTDGELADWQAGFDNVTEIGFYLVHTTLDEMYAFDNIGLLAIPIPEPGSMMLLGSALLSLTLTFRKKIGVRARELLKN